MYHKGVVVGGVTQHYHWVPSSRLRHTAPCTTHALHYTNYTIHTTAIHCATLCYTVPGDTNEGRTLHHKHYSYTLCYTVLHCAHLGTPMKVGIDRTRAPAVVSTPQASMVYLFGRRRGDERRREKSRGHPFVLVHNHVLV